MLEFCQRLLFSNDNQSFHSCIRYSTLWGWITDKPKDVMISYLQAFDGRGNKNTSEFEETSKRSGSREGQPSLDGWRGGLQDDRKEKRYCSLKLEMLLNVALCTRIDGTSVEQQGQATQNHGSPQHPEADASDLERMYKVNYRKSKANV